VKAPVTALASAFEAEAGCRVALTFGPVGTLRTKAAAGEQADLLVLSAPVLRQLQEGGLVLPGTIVALGQVGVGIAVRSGARHPDIATSDALRTTLLSARSISHGDPAQGDSSGMHFARVLHQLGIAEAVRGKTILSSPQKGVAELVRQGEAELGATQASVILTSEGVALTGLLPGELQHFTVYAAAITSKAICGDLAQRFLGKLGSDLAREAFERAGLAATPSGFQRCA
jgi:molybdate transport system substrate-binding protein